MIKFPAFIDIAPEIPEQNWKTASQAAIYAGYTAILSAMPEKKLFMTRSDAEAAAAEPTRQALCDFGLLASLRPENVRSLGEWIDEVPSVFVRINEPTPDTMFSGMKMLTTLFNHFPKEKPICVSGENDMIASPLFLAQTNHRRIHISSVTTRKEIELIREAKENGAEVTCDVHPLALMMSLETYGGRSPLKRIGTEDDRKALLENLSLISCFSTAGILANKLNPYAAWNMMFPLLVTLLKQGVLTEADIADRCYRNPRSIFGLYPESDTVVEIDESLIQTKKTNSEKRSQTNCVQKVILRGETLYDANIKADIPEGKARQLKGYRS